jgi:hypothetical protein
MPALTMLAVVVGVLVFLILGATSATSWWLAVVIGIGLTLVVTLVDGLVQGSRVNTEA